MGSLEVTNLQEHRLTNAYKGKQDTQNNNMKDIIQNSATMIEHFMASYANLLILSNRNKCKECRIQWLVISKYHVHDDETRQRKRERKKIICLCGM